VGTGTQFSIAGYRYSTSGYYGMQEILDSYGDSSALQDRRRNRAELTMSQTLGGNLGSLTLIAAREDYWNSGKTMASYSLGYNNYWRNISYGLTWTYSKNGSAGSYDDNKRYDNDRLLAFNVSIPLDKFLPQTWANYGVSASRNNGTTQNVGLNGVALENHALNWNVQQGYGSDGVGYTGNMNGDYKGTYGEATAGYSYDKNSERLNYGLQGGILAHREGLTLSQPLGETNVLISAPGARGVDIRNQPGVRTDYRGYTVVSNLSVYRKNDITLAPESLPDDVELDINTRAETSTRGAIVLADYKAKVGRRALFNLLHNGQYVPFGATASLKGADGSSVIVGDRGQAYLTGLDAQGTVFVSWGADSDRQCRAPYVLSPQPSAGGITEINVNCL
jgi:outer membrane usher protein